MPSKGAVRVNVVEPRLGQQDRGLAGAQRRARFIEGTAGAGIALHQLVGALVIRLGEDEGRLGLDEFGALHRGIELDQHLALLGLLAFGEVDLDDAAGDFRLDDDGFVRADRADGEHLAPAGADAHGAASTGMAKPPGGPPRPGAPAGACAAIWAGRWTKYQ